MTPRSIASINQLPQPVKEALYTRFIPDVLLRQFNIAGDFRDSQGRRLLDLRCASGATDVVLAVRRSLSDPDPLLYVHLTDTVMGQIHILLYVVNDPDSPRFDVDRMPDGSPTQFGSLHRNLTGRGSCLSRRARPGTGAPGCPGAQGIDRCLRGVCRLPRPQHLSRRAAVLPQRHPVRAIRIQLPARPGAHGRDRPGILPRRHAPASPGQLHPIPSPSVRIKHPRPKLGHPRRHSRPAARPDHHVQDRR